MTASSRRSRFWLYNSTYLVIMLAKSRCGLCPAGTEGMFCVPGACYKNNAMLCLQCHRWQPKQAWSPAQWKAVNPVLLDHSRNCCSDCSINWWCPAPSPRPTTSPCEGATRGAATGARRDHEPGWVQSVLVVLRIASSDELIQRTYRLAAMGSLISEFMEHWMNTLGKTHRKLLSYSGALRYRPGMDGFIRRKGDWTDPVSGQRYFDPTNDVYSKAFHIAFPKLASRTDRWSAETHGDIFEGILAVKWLDDYGTARKLRGHPNFAPESPAVRIAAWIEELVTLVWGVCLIYPSDDSPAMWAQRWQHA